MVNNITLWQHSAAMHSLSWTLFQCTSGGPSPLGLHTMPEEMWGKSSDFCGECLKNVKTYQHINTIQPEIRPKVTLQSWHHQSIYIYIYMYVYIYIYIIYIYIYYIIERRRKPGSDLVLILTSFRNGFRGSFARTVLAFAATCIS